MTASMWEFSVSLPLPSARLGSEWQARGMRSELNFQRRKKYLNSSSDHPQPTLTLVPALRTLELPA